MFLQKILLLLANTHLLSLVTMKKLNLALQGGGSHGAFTWGVIDRLLEEPDLAIGDLCGTSAGAMNATVLAYGLNVGGPAKAKELMFEFWSKVSKGARMSSMQPSWYDRWLGAGNMDYSPGFLMADMVMQHLSPYQFNPMDYNPLRDIVTELVDFDRLRNCHENKLFLCATNVRRGRTKVFPLAEVTIDAVMASACLPFLFKAVTIDGEDYWDGGYMGNPPIFPLIDGSDSSDIMIIQINPIEIKQTPTTVVEIRDRVNEITFNSSLMLEMRRVNFVQKLLERGIDLDGKLHTLRIHAINPQEDIAELNISSKLNADWDFLMYLFELGRKYAKEWLDENKEKVGVKSSCDISEMFL